MSGPGAEETAVLVVAHGRYAAALVRAAEDLLGPLGLQVVELAEEIPAAQRLAHCRAEVERRVGGQRSLLILTDLCGSTPANVCLSLVQEHRGWDMLTGVSLPVLMKLSTCDRRQPAAALASQLGASARRTILSAAELSRATEEESRGSGT